MKYCLLFLFFFNTVYSVEHDPFAVIPIPKCGTHLSRNFVPLLADKKLTGVKTTRNSMPELLKIQKKNEIPKFYEYHPSAENNLRKLGYKWVFIYRDPRDACVSLVFYLDQFTGFFRDVFRIPKGWNTFSFDEKLHRVMNGKGAESYIERWYKPMLQWNKPPLALAIRFEDLVGAKGGGDDEAQREALLQIIDHVSLVCDEERVDHVCEHLFKPPNKLSEANGETFHRGQMGNWKLFFNESHKAYFKEHFNDILIELWYEQDDCW